jgi:6-phosphogluconolactonase
LGTPKPGTATREIHILADAAAIGKRAAQEILQAGTSAVAQRGSFTLVLAGGSTPKTLYQLLVNDAALRAQLPWDKMVLLFGDERNVPPDHADSNFRTATEAMISKAPLKPEQILRIKGEYKDTEKAALEYEQTLRSSFKLRDGELPRFDVVLLGMGNDGHSLSLFPGTKALHPERRLVVRNWIGKLYAERITMTAPTVNNAEHVIFMVTGNDKALALKGVLEGPYEPEQLPSQFIQPRNGKVQWLVDTAAGSMLSTGLRE